MEDIMIRVNAVTKQYKLGQIGGTTLRDELQRKRAKLFGKEDPTQIIGTRHCNTGDIFLALNNITFDIKKGERVGIIGHNGAGKSTLLKLLSRVTAPTHGWIGLNGRVASMLEVGTGFHGELTGRENIYMNGAILGMTKKEIDSKIDDIIDFSECRQFIDTPVKRYSSGMYVKLAFSVAAHLDSEIMIMDEVLAVGDMAFQKKCLEKMSDVSKTEGRTILYVSHNMDTIRALCDRCIVLHHGGIIFDGAVEDAIQIYMSANYEESISINYYEKPDARLMLNGSVSTISAEYLNKKDYFFSQGEKLTLRLKWQNEVNIENLCLRIEIREQNRKIIGTAFLYDFYSGEKGEVGMVDVAVNISNLVIGKYASTYTFFLRNDIGLNGNADNVKGLNFEKTSYALNLYWDKYCWGNVLFPDIEVLK